MEWVWCIRCEKFQNDYMAQTCALIAPLQPVLHRVSSINETLPNAPKHYEKHQNMSLGFNWVDRVFVFKNSDAASWHELVHYFYHFSPLCIDFRAVTKQSKMHQIMSLGSNGVDRVDSLQKKSDANSWHELLH